MLIASSTVILSAIACTPILVASACISKIFSTITSFKPVDVSRLTFIKEMAEYTRASDGLTSMWACNKTIHVLCRHATIFSNYPPIVIIHGSGSSSFNYAEFMQSIPKVYDVYCIDLPGWGISEDPHIDLESDALEQSYAYYAKTIMNTLSEIYPVPYARFMFVGHSFGAFILLKSIALRYIPSYKIESCTLSCMPGLHTLTSKYYFIGTLFRFGFLESIFKQWWSRHLFSAFLYRKKTQLQTLQNMHRFIPNGTGYKLIGKQITFKWFFSVRWFRFLVCVFNPVRSQLLSISNTVRVNLVGGLRDLVIDTRHVKDVSDESNNTIKCHLLEGGHSLFSQKELFSKLLSIIEDDNNV